MKDEYIIINKTAIQKRIEELKKYCVEKKPSPTEFATFNHTILELKEILSKSAHLIPELEKAFDAGHRICKGGFMYVPSKREYVTKLKLDI